jgi:hypothetical protein
MDPAVQELMLALLERLSAIPISSVLSQVKNGILLNPFAEASDAISQFSCLADFATFVEGLLDPECPEDCEDPDLFREICETLRRKFDSECHFLRLLERSRFQDALFEIQTDLFPDVTVEHLAEVRAQQSSDSSESDNWESPSDFQPADLAAMVEDGREDGL